jgi:hypothetical protein
LLEAACGLAKLYGYPAMEMLCTARLYQRLSRADRTIAILGGAISASKPVSEAGADPQIAVRVDPPRTARSRSFRLRAETRRFIDTSRALPRRCFRRACLLLPHGAVPRRFLRWSYLDVAA